MSPFKTTTIRESLGLFFLFIFIVSAFLSTFYSQVDKRSRRKEKKDDEAEQ